MSFLNRKEIRKVFEETLDKEFLEQYMNLLRPRMIAGECSHYVYMRRFPDIGEYHVRVGNNFVRVFTLRTMPPKLKEVIAMIHATDWPHGDSEQIPMSRPDYVSENFVDIGWMTSKYEYVLCLPNDFLDELTGKVPV